MKSAALAIGWTFRKQHAWPLVAMAIYLFGLAVFRLTIYEPGEPITVIPPDGRAAVVIGPLSWAFFYYLAVFSFGLSGDLGARQSIFPARMFALPVKTSALVAWPMLYGTLTVAALVLATTLLARWPWQIDAPLLWPALFAASFLAWMQALMWMPYGLPALRPIVTVLWLGAFDAVVVAAAYYKLSEPVMLAILAPQIPLAFLVARYAVGRARRGDVPDWRPRFLRAESAPRSALLERAGFATSARAQLWFEWRRQGRTLPALVAIVLPFELALFWIARDAPWLLLELLLLALITPPLLASFSAATVSKANPDARDSFVLSPFIATRPISSAELVAAKLKMAIWSTIATWLLVVVAVPLALIWSGNWPIVMERLSGLVEIVGTPRTIVFSLLVLAALMVSTWRQLVQSMYIGLTGRAWIGRAAVIGVLAFVVFIGPVVQWLVDDHRARGLLWHSLPALLAALVAFKTLAAAVVAVRLARSGLLSDRTLVGAAAVWVATVLAGYGVLAWLVSGPLIPQYVLVLLAILAVPLARVGAAPMALAWNRHR